MLEQEQAAKEQIVGSTDPEQRPPSKLELERYQCQCSHALQKHADPYMLPGTFARAFSGPCSGRSRLGTATCTCPEFALQPMGPG